MTTPTTLTENLHPLVAELADASRSYVEQIAEELDAGTALDPRQAGGILRHFEAIRWHAGRIADHLRTVDDLRNGTDTPARTPDVERIIAKARNILRGAYAALTGARAQAYQALEAVEDDADTIGRDVEMVLGELDAAD